MSEPFLEVEYEVSRCMPGEALRSLAEHDIRPGDTVFVYSDGTVTVGRQYGGDEAREVFMALRHQRPLALDSPALRGVVGSHLQLV